MARDEGDRLGSVRCKASESRGGFIPHRIPFQRWGHLTGHSSRSLRYTPTGRELISPHNCAGTQCPHGDIHQGSEIVSVMAPFSRTSHVRLMT
jgi:hypothetical protein